ncbi:cobalt transport protein [Xylanimonas cellulosilytica DSM 15894]|uniref:Cobalt transport protein n=1 Tax=Xylanimonas cellulosilytica (strain DSM 15894 / JCM 12276 / CECT 5975 / KCTC 9989 / LMG 20990 / NBRC 107835 / XIL07) TaxID=446471 RepID=D1BZU9_XYLCX|nr:CbiQ family ECF transporter T component [Xylanimonas cellulosilytica]ACZ32077.1 cobalt transport protein [Xylanimonas cellulosilytica DSM 15894]
MLTMYRPGSSAWHRLPAGRKTVLLLALVLGVCLLPATWSTAGVVAVLCVTCYAFLDLRLRELARQVWAARWIVVITLAGQLLFLGPEDAAGNTARVTAAVVIAGLLMLTTPTTSVLAVLERAMGPLARLGVDPQRAALLLTVTLNTLPVLAQLARDLHEAQRARGVRGNLRLFVTPFLILALKHADQLGEALTARGVR